MVTVRTFTNPAEAALAKSVLDNYEIPCALLYESSNVYTEGAQFAVPIELVVEEACAGRAFAILSGDFERAAETDSIEPVNESSPQLEPSAESDNQNPWELLLLAFYLVVPAICLLTIRFPQFSSSSRIRSLIARANVTQFLAILELLLAALLIWIYFRVRDHQSGKSRVDSA